MQLEKFRSHLPDYVGKYEHIRMRREDGVLELTLHSAGGPLRWSRHAHMELEEAFMHIGRDRANQVVILTGCGDEFSGPVPDPAANRATHKRTPAELLELGWEVKGLLGNMLAIDVPMIAAVNGPAARHAELPILCDIVLAAEHASFQDAAHFVGGLVPGDGVHVAFPMVMGLNRARYYLLTGQVVPAREAHQIGMVNEVLPREQLLPRAWELARLICRQPEMVRRYTRLLVTEPLRRQMNDLLPYGYALEAMGVVGS